MSNQHFFLSIKFTISWTFQYWILIDFPIFIILHSSILNLSFFIIPQDFQCHSRNMLAWFKRIRFLVQSFSINAIHCKCMLCHYRNLSNCVHHHEWHQLAKLTKWSRFMPNKTDGKIRRNIVREEHNPFNRCTWTIKIILWMQYKENQNNTLFIRKYSQFYTCSSHWPLLKSLIVINIPFTASWYVKRISIFYLSLLRVNKKIIKWFPW